MSAPRRPGDDKPRGRRAGSRDRRGAPPREARPTGSKPGEEDKSEGKPARAGAKTGKPRTARSEAWATAKAPRDGDRSARPSRGSDKPRTGRKGASADREDRTSTGQGKAPWSREPADAKPGATKPRPPRHADRSEAPAPRASRRAAETGRPPRTATEGRPTRKQGETSAPRPPRNAAATDAPRGRPPRAERPHGERPRADRSRPAPRAAKTSAPAAEAASSAFVRKTPQRIAKLLARAGVASRREIERMIAEGRIALNGTTLDTPATILTSLQGVTVDGHAVDAPEPTRLFLFHKPVGFLTTEYDPKGRPTIYDRLPEGLPRVMPVGRLDMNTEGLLLLTTDGEFKRKLELPSTGVPRIYRARAYGEVTQEQLEALSEGITIEGIRYGSIDANMERRTGRNVWIEMKITEGKNREVRRVLEYLGLQVSRLIRVAYGEFILADLPAGEVVEVRQHDLEEFRKTLR